MIFGRHSHSPLHIKKRKEKKRKEKKRKEKKSFRSSAINSHREPPTRHQENKMQWVCQKVFGVNADNVLLIGLITILRTKYVSRLSGLTLVGSLSKPSGKTAAIPLAVGAPAITLTYMEQVNVKSVV